MSQYSEEKSSDSKRVRQLEQEVKQLKAALVKRATSSGDKLIPQAVADSAIAVPELHRKGEARSGRRKSFASRGTERS